MIQGQDNQQQDQTIFSFIQPQSEYKCYRLINKRTNECLTQGPQPSCRSISKTNIKQLWTFQKHKEDYSSIVSFGSGLALTRNNNSQNISCEKFKTKQTQMWKIEFCYQDKKTQQKYFWLVSKVNQQECIFGTVNMPNLRLLKLDRTLFTSLWKIQEVDQNDKNFGFCQIRSLASNLLLQAPDTPAKQQGPIIQTKQQGKGAQKWIIQKLFNNYVIRNLCSGLVMSVGQQVKDNFQILNILGKQPKNCRKIFQEVFQNSNSQKWNLIKISQNEFYFQSIEDTDKFIGCISLKQRVPVYLIGSDNYLQQMRNVIWKIKGALPQSAIKQKMLDISQSIKRQSV